MEQHFSCYYFSLTFHFQTYSYRDNSPAIGCILEALAPENAPKLRRLVLLPGLKGRHLPDGLLKGDQRLDLPHLETLILGCSFSRTLCQQLMLPEGFPSLRRLTFNPLELRMSDLVRSNGPTSGIFSRLTHLTLNMRMRLMMRSADAVEAFHFIIAQCATSSGHSSLEYLALNKVGIKVQLDFPTLELPSLLFYLAPVAASLKHLRVDLSGFNCNPWVWPVPTPQAAANEHFRLPPLPATGAIFSKLATLHLAHSKLLYRYGLHFLLKLFIF